MRKLIWTLVILVVVGVFGGRVWYLNQHKQIGDNVVKIGGFLPLSGPLARDGVEFLKGLKIAQNQINNDSQYNFKIDLRMEDSKFSATQAVSLFNRLVDSNALISSGTPSTASIAPLLEQHKIPTISLINAEDKTILASSQIFRGWIAARTTASEIGHYIVSEYPEKTVALLRTHSSTDAKEFEEGLLGQLNKIGKQVQATETFAVTDMETNAQVLKLMDKNPDIIVVYGYAQGYIAAINSLIRMGYKGDIITTWDIEMNSSLIPNNASGIYFVTPTYDFSELVKEDKTTNNNFFVAFGYETLRLLAEAMKNGTKPEQIREGLANLKDVETGFGKVSYDERGELYLPPFVLKQMQPDGTAKVVKE
ncbi:MAG: ABC transporter substrate-binding protein [Alphaproteobacteria bacterium]|nr:ABC transporter substrate-binding protein [Alphaproteobacteria bacterium]